MLTHTYKVEQSDKVVWRPISYVSTAKTTAELSKNSETSTKYNYDIETTTKVK